TIISATVLWSIRATILEPPVETRPVSRSAIKSQPVIAVAGLTKRVGDASLDWLGQGIANLLRDSMADSPLTIVYSLAALQSLNSETDSSQNLAQAAKDAGVDYLIAGDYMSTASGIVISIHIEDLDNGTIIPGDRIEAASVEEAIAETDQLVRRLKQTLNLPYVSQVGHLAADFAAENLQAYELYISGLDYLAQFDYENAKSLMQAAINEAPQFGIARYRLSQILEATGRNREAFQILNTIQTDSLTEREQLYVNGARHLYSENRDTAAAITVFLEAVSRFPFDSEAHQNLAEAYWFDFENEASINQLEELIALHPQEAVSWMALGERQLEIGDVNGARTSLAKYVSMRPDDPYPHALLGELASHERRYAEARTHYQQALVFRPNMGIPEIGLARLAYYEGKIENAMLRWRTIVEGTDVAADYRIDAAFDHTFILRALGRPQDALEILALIDEDIRREGFREALTLTVKAELLVDLGELRQARDFLSDAIDKTPASRQPTRPYFHLALIGLQEADHAGFSDVVEVIRALPAEPGSVIDSDRIAAIHYLMGVSLLGADPTAAASEFEQAIDTPNHFPYRLYELGLAEAKLTSGDFAAAMSVLERISEVNPADPRFDLEYDRRLKLVLEAEALAAAGRTSEARDLAARLSAIWPDAATQPPAMRRLLNAMTPN
ncbi:MAG: tetratricopeptide repeat protein, partial [Gammaproteobacteria bacterium]